MSRGLRLSIGAICLLAALVDARVSLRAAVLAQWVAYVADGGVEARVVTDEPACPMIEIDGAANAMAERTSPDPAFPIRICFARLPTSVKTIVVGGQSLPLPVSDPKRIVVLGDTGCRIKFLWLQACNDPAAWPFKMNAATAAAMRPDLVIHVGDYHYRESPCPLGISGCAGSPYGDNWAAWRADFFDPAQPLLAAAPWIMVRGNHEDCGRAGRGWTRLLAPGAYDPTTPCLDHEPPYAVRAGDRNLLVLDTAVAPDERNDPRVAPLYRADFEAVARLAAGPSWLLMHRPIWGIYAIDGFRVIGGNLTLAAATKGRMPPSIELLIAGHIHVLEIANYASGQPPEIIVGHGGDDLSTITPAQLDGLDVAGARVRDGFSLTGFGFLVLDKAAAGWEMSIHDSAGRLLRHCALGDRQVVCPGA